MVLALQEEYSNARYFSDGDIHRNLRHAQLEGDGVREGKRLGQLSDSKLDDLRQLREKMPPFQRAFEALLPIPGLWGLEARLGTLRRGLRAQCPEVTMFQLHR
jgi:hypothetical protein